VTTSTWVVEAGPSTVVVTVVVKVLTKSVRKLACGRNIKDAGGTHLAGMAVVVRK
jgi:hypothetical protein